MGYPITLKGKSYNAHLVMDDVGTEEGKHHSRRKVIRGMVRMRWEDWNDSGAIEGDSITLPDGISKIITAPTEAKAFAQFTVEGRF